MTRAQMEGLFAIAGIQVLKAWELPNKYWPDGEHYAQVRRENPWWLVRTPFGLIEIGWRKRVISIDWSDTPIRHVVTTDEVTKDETMVHAYSYEKAITYLTALAAVVGTPPDVSPPNEQSALPTQ